MVAKGEVGPSQKDDFRSCNRVSCRRYKASKTCVGEVVVDGPTVQTGSCCTEGGVEECP